MFEHATITGRQSESEAAMTPDSICLESLEAEQPAATRPCASSSEIPAWPAKRVLFLSDDYWIRWNSAVGANQRGIGGLTGTANSIGT